MSRYSIFRRRPKSSVMFHGMKIVRMHDTCCREAIRFFRDGNLIAVIQKNGNIAVSSSGIFDDEKNVFAQWNVARCLHGLKMVGPEFVEAHRKRTAAKERMRDLESIEADVERLGGQVLRVGGRMEMSIDPVVEA
jgi:hypothetical protein